MDKLPPLEINPNKRKFPRIPVILMILAVIFIAGFYFSSPDKGKGPLKGLLQPSPTASPFAKAQIVKGTVTAIKEGTVFLVKEGGQIAMTVKLLPQTLVVKQIRINSYTTGTEKAEIKAKDLISLTAVKDKDGAWTTNSIIIIDPNLNK